MRVNLACRLRDKFGGMYLGKDGNWWECKRPDLSLARVFDNPTQAFAAYFDLVKQGRVTDEAVIEAVSGGILDVKDPKNIADYKLCARLCIL